MMNWDQVKMDIGLLDIGWICNLSCPEPAWGIPPVAKVIRKEARHTQRWDQASGVSLEIFAVFLAAAKLLPKLLIILKIFVSDHNSDILLFFLASFFYILKITSIFLKPKIWRSIISDRKHIIPYSWRSKWQPTPVFLPGEFHGQRSLERFSLWGCKKSDMTEQLTHTHTIVLCRILSAMQGNRHVNCGMCRGRDRVQFSSVASDSLQPHESQHARPPCPSPTPGVHSDSRPSSQWCHPAISSSVVPFSSCPQSLPASEIE